MARAEYKAKKCNVGAWDPMPVWTGSLTLYHGTDAHSAEDIISSGVRLLHSQTLLDFGPGFYMTSNQRQAWKWAGIKSNSNFRRLTAHKDKGVVLEVELYWAALADLRTISFASDVEGSGYWGMVKGSRRIDGASVRLDSPNDQYDLIIGPVAGKPWSVNRHIISKFDQFCFRSTKGIALLTEAKFKVSAQP